MYSLHYLVRAESWPGRVARHRATFAQREIIGSELLPFDQRHGQAVREPGAEFLHQVQRQRRAVGTLRVHEPDRGVPRLSMRSQAEVQHRLLALADLQRFVAGADVFSRQSDGTTIAAQYAKQGITLRCANTDRVNGWAEIMTRFGDVEAGIRPTLFIHQRCGRLVETLPALQHDPNRPEDVLKVDADDEGVGGDDAADALRYLVATKSRTITARKLRGL